MNEIVVIALNNLLTEDINGIENLALPVLLIKSTLDTVNLDNLDKDLFLDYCSLNFKKNIKTENIADIEEFLIAFYKNIIKERYNGNFSLLYNDINNIIKEFMDIISLKNILSIKELCEYWNRNPNPTRKFIKNNLLENIDYRKSGGIWFIKYSSVIKKLGKPIS
ncbi:hypothetical protein [Clostridium baratii]|uniref:hypothetical protein n=1 Tax=Clostridium baratii TaxID=1561 RepID=UPI0005F2A656|nr:hypothetical protein [Clostridium baratii]AQM58564.1 hypothetical protein NPD11_3027 [Clostridium baratii]KJU71545.1 hypothetical protein UC77_09015 [Clostridium baratii]